MGIRVPPALIGEMKKADLIVALGERLTDTVSQSYTFPAAPQPQLPLVHIWPDPNEVGRVWRADLGMPCDPYEVVEGLAGKGAPPDRGESARGWVDGLHRIHLSLLEKTWEPTTDGINFAAVVCEIDKHLADDAVITSDAGNFGSFHTSLYRLQAGSGVPVVGRRRHGVGHADGRGRRRCAGPAGRSSPSWATAAR